jgi:hypothetical protein
MKIIQVNTATNRQLNWLVARCEGWVWRDGPSSWYGIKPWIELHDSMGIRRRALWKLAYTDHAELMWPIVDREIDVIRKRSKTEEGEIVYPNPYYKFKAEIYADVPGYFCGFGPTSLIAAARCYVVSKLGEAVEIPDGLT